MTSGKISLIIAYDIVYTPDDIVIEGEIEAGKHYGEDDFTQIIQIKEREEYRVKLFMAQMDQREKTLVFCANQLHALAVRDLINQIKTSRDPNYCQRVTAKDGKLGEQYLRDFQDNEKHIPTILTTSHKLATGVDARNVRNIEKSLGLPATPGFFRHQCSVFPRRPQRESNTRPKV